MFKNIFLVITLVGCETAERIEDMPPDTVGTVLYPCNIQHGACQAAKQLAKARCEIRFCDPLVSITWTECVAQEMGNVCAQYFADTGNTCNSPYHHWYHLDACLADFEAAGCDGADPMCGLTPTRCESSGGCCALAPDADAVRECILATDTPASSCAITCVQSDCSELTVEFCETH